MIDPKELEIGDWVVCPKGLAEVKVIDSRTCDILVWSPKGSDWCGKVSDLRPISLTDAVLEAIKGTFAGCGEIARVSMESDGFNILKFAESYYINPVSEKEPYISGVQVKYLHQLQNLYFALTGSELEIDETKLKQAL